MKNENQIKCTETLTIKLGPLRSAPLRSTPLLTPNLPSAPLLRSKPVHSLTEGKKPVGSPLYVTRRSLGVLRSSPPSSFVRRHRHSFVAVVVVRRTFTGIFFRRRRKLQIPVCSHSFELQFIHTACGLVCPSPQPVVGRPANARKMMIEISLDRFDLLTRSDSYSYNVCILGKVSRLAEGITKSY
ncbi:hypothetical protein ACS0TY_022575 [Phlomoides rotata]